MVLEVIPRELRVNIEEIKVRKMVVLKSKDYFMEARVEWAANYLCLAFGDLRKDLSPNFSLN